MTLVRSLRSVARTVLPAMLAVFVGATATLAQGWGGLPPPPPAPPRGGYAAPPGGAPASQMCIRLESQLAALDRGSADPGRADQIRRFEDAAAKQQFELDRTVAQSRRLGCERTGFFLFGGGDTPPQCDQLTPQIQRMRGNLDRIMNDLQRLQSGSSVDRGDQRRALLVALGENNCGPQYRNASPAQRGFVDTIVGGGPTGDAGPDGAPAGTFRTVCVRTCDGFYFPISFATVPAKFNDDEKVCQRMCPASEAVLFSHRNPGEDMNSAVSISGRPYKDLPNAFRYRQEFNAACSCKKPGQSWAEAMGMERDATIERGDIVVTEERARAMSQPQKQGPAKGKAGAKDVPAPAAAGPQAAPSSASADRRTIRSVGPTFVPAR